MDPIAFHVGQLPIRWYGVFVALGFLAAFYLVQYNARKKGFSKDAAADLVFIAMLGGILGARLFYVVQNWGDYRGNLLEIVRVDHGGLVFYGGFFGALVAVGLACFRKSYSVAEVGDVFAPALPLGHALGRVGCFLNGCCHGKPWSGIAAVHYPQISQPVFPIQLVSSAMNLFICVVLLGLSSRLRRRGQLFPIYMLLYATGRFVVEFARGDYAAGQYVGPFTPAQIICLLLLPVGTVWLVAVRRSALGGFLSE